MDRFLEHAREMIAVQGGLAGDETARTEKGDVSLIYCLHLILKMLDSDNRDFFMDKIASQIPPRLMIRLLVPLAGAWLA